MAMLCLSVAAQMYGQRTITGTVQDEDNLPLIGANVLVQGTGIGSVTDIDGKFEIDVPSDATVLVASYTGYSDQEIEIGPSNVLNITLAQSDILLDQVVVTAFGIERERKEIGYAITSVDGADLSKARSSNVLQSMSGRVPGVRINSSSGTAGGGVNIQIRGANSIGGRSSPLFVVDGVPISNSSFNGTRSEIISGS